MGKSIETKDTSIEPVEKKLKKFAEAVLPEAYS